MGKIVVVYLFERVVCLFEKKIVILHAKRYLEKIFNYVSS